jgi:hypothetical protein
MQKASSGFNPLSTTKKTTGKPLLCNRFIEGRISWIVVMHYSSSFSNIRNEKV